MKDVWKIMNNYLKETGIKDVGFATTDPLGWYMDSLDQAIFFLEMETRCGVELSREECDRCKDFLDVYILISSKLD
jgi:hypothetical protein